MADCWHQPWSPLVEFACDVVRAFKRGNKSCRASHRTRHVKLLKLHSMRCRRGKQKLPIAARKTLKRVIDKVAAAAEALGWPEEIADTVRTQMQSITKMQSQMMDQMISAWEEQMESPSSPSLILSKLKSLPTLPAGSWPGVASQMTNPFEASIQIAQQWQKTWMEAMAPWMKAGSRN